MYPVAYSAIPFPVLPAGASLDPANAATTKAGSPISDYDDDTPQQAPLRIMPSKADGLRFALPNAPGRNATFSKEPRLSLEPFPKLAGSFLGHANAATTKAGGHISVPEELWSFLAAGASCLDPANAATEVGGHISDNDDDTPPPAPPRKMPSKADGLGFAPPNTTYFEEPIPEALRSFKQKSGTISPLSFHGFPVLAAGASLDPANAATEVGGHISDDDDDTPPPRRRMLSEADGLSSAPLIAPNPFTSRIVGYFDGHPIVEIVPSGKQYVITERGLQRNHRHLVAMPYYGLHTLRSTQTIASSILGLLSGCLAAKTALIFKATVLSTSLVAVIAGSIIFGIGMIYTWYFNDQDPNAQQEIRAKQLRDQTIDLNHYTTRKEKKNFLFTKNYTNIKDLVNDFTNLDRLNLLSSNEKSDYQWRLLNNPIIALQLSNENQDEVSQEEVNLHMQTFLREFRGKFAESEMAQSHILDTNVKNMYHRIHLYSYSEPFLTL